MKEESREALREECCYEWCDYEEKKEICDWGALTWEEITAKAGSEQCSEWECGKAKQKFQLRKASTSAEKADREHEDKLYVESVTKKSANREKGG